MKLHWIYILEKNFTYNIGNYFSEPLGQACAFEDSRGNRWLELYPDGRAVILAGYAWDGCTPKWSLFDIPIGVPDGIPNSYTCKPKAYYASLVHDALCQFQNANLPVTRKSADYIFLEILTRDEFALRHIYWAAVRIFGILSFQFTRMKRGYKGRKVAI
jgi:hypothetical protein